MEAPPNELQYALDKIFMISTSAIATIERLAKPQTQDSPKANGEQTDGSRSTSN